MSTHVDGAAPSVAPSVAPDPADGDPRPDTPPPTAATGSEWVRAEMQRRMAANRTSRGRHARRAATPRDGDEPTGPVTMVRAGGRRRSAAPPPWVAAPPSAADLPENYVPRHSVQTPGPAADPSPSISGPIPVVRPADGAGAAFTPAVLDQAPPPGAGPIGGPSLPASGLPVRRRRGSGPGTPLQAHGTPEVGPPTGPWMRPSPTPRPVVPQEPARRLGAPPRTLGAPEPIPAWGLPLATPARGLATPGGPPPAPDRRGDAGGAAHTGPAAAPAAGGTTPDDGAAVPTSTSEPAADGVRGEGVPGVEVAGGEVPGDGVPGDGVPGDGVPDDGVPGDEVPDDRVPEAWDPAVEDPAVEDPAVEDPAVEDPAVEDPAVEDPAGETDPDATGAGAVRGVRVAVDRPAANAPAVNGSSAQDSSAQGSSAHGSSAHGSAVNGSPGPGSTAHDSATHGAAASGAPVDGVPVNGSTVNGSAVNGRAVNGRAVAGREVGDPPTAPQPVVVGHRGGAGRVATTGGHPVAVPAQRTADSARALAPRPATPRNMPVVGTAPEPGSTRVRVVLSERKGIARTVRTIKEVQEGTPVGVLLRRDLIRSQLRVTLRFAVVMVLVLGGLPAVFAFFPQFGEFDVLGVRLPWIMLGVLVYPFLFLVAWHYARLADRVEQSFADHVQDR